MQENNRPNWLIIVGIGCAVVLCLCLLVVGGVAIFGGQALSGLGNIPGIAEIQELLETGEIPVPPSGQEPFPDDPSQTGEQVSDQAAFFDDFSSDAFDWAVVDDGSTVLQYENQAYSMELQVPDFLDSVEIPTYFYPSYVKFDIWGPPGEQSGTVGVECMVQLDADGYLSDYYYAEFDLYYQDVLIGGVINNEAVYFYDLGETYGFLPTENMQSNPDQVNTIEVTCTPEQVTVVVNGQFEHAIAVPSEYMINTPGLATFFVYTYTESAGGYKVYFDNVSAMP